MGCLNSKDGRGRSPTRKTTTGELRAAYSGSDSASRRQEGGVSRRERDSSQKERSSASGERRNASGLPSRAALAVTPQGQERNPSFTGEGNLAKLEPRRSESSMRNLVGTTQEQQSNLSSTEGANIMDAQPLSELRRTDPSGRRDPTRREQILPQKSRTSPPRDEAASKPRIYPRDQIVDTSSSRDSSPRDQIVDTSSSRDSSPRNQIIDASSSRGSPSRNQIMAKSSLRRDQASSSDQRISPPKQRQAAPEPRKMQRDFDPKGKQPVVAPGQQEMQLPYSLNQTIPTTSQSVFPFSHPLQQSQSTSSSPASLSSSPTHRGGSGDASRLPPHPGSAAVGVPSSSIFPPTPGSSNTLRLSSSPPSAASSPLSSPTHSSHVKGCRCIKCRPQFYDDRSNLVRNWRTPCVAEGCQCPICTATCDNQGHMLPKHKQCRRHFCACKMGCYDKNCPKCAAAFLETGMSTRGSSGRLKVGST